MTHPLIRSTVIVLAIALATPAFADPIHIVSNGSGIAGVIHAIEGDLEDLIRFPDTPDGNNAFDLTALAGDTSVSGSASIASDLSDLLHIRASGSTSASYTTSIGEGGANVSSHFFMFFEIDRPLGFVFDGTFTTSGDTLSIREREHWSQWNVSLLPRGDGNTSTPVLLGSGNHTTTIVRDGLLLPGLYRFLVHGTSFAGTFVPGPAAGNVFSNFSFSLALTELDPEAPAVPEPATLLLLGTGLAGTVAARRRQKRVLAR